MSKKTKPAKKKDEDTEELTEADIVDKANKEVGAETLRYGLDSGGISKITAISTRALAVDVALGVGGVPRGRIVEIFGDEGSGKTTLCLSILAQCQTDGGAGAFIDAEHALDPSWCRTLGVDTKKILFSQPDSAEQIFKIIRLLINHRKVSLVIVDSVAAMITEAELAKEPGDRSFPETARLFSQELRKLKGEISKTNTCVIFINQIRDKIGSPIPATGTTGGRALKFYSSQRLDVRRISSVKQGEDIVGSHVKVNVVKNKVAPPFKTAEFDILYDRGISKPHELVSLGLKYKVLKRNGSWVAYNGENLGQGAIGAGDVLAGNSDLMAELEKKLYSIIYPEIQEAKITEEELVEG